ncbi:MAG: MFS transporter [Ignavibacteriae bacterium HGW-Ignavibacteriae-2]|jgi:dipeptide/tripeptide permease|nr:MFS transporter [Bacteroidota bacterium]PKL89682.1 MAG: MFS transporter [Ignavibacteriae bacterium HGW-Ignavibacteriae-2]
MDSTVQVETWKFPKEFWLANVMELFERAAYYGFFIVLTLYLTDIVGFTDTETGVVAGVFFALLYFFPPFVGAIGDKIGFKNGLIIAFSLLTIGYFFLGIFHSKVLVIFFLFVVLIGGSFIKPLITGTIAKTTSAINKARGFSLFYWIVNIGAFSGKTVVPSIRQGIGLEYVNFFSAGMSLLGLILALILFKPLDSEKAGKSIKDVFNALKKIFSTPRLIILTLIVSGFWIIQHQLYATMPKYVIRLLGEEAKPEWLANVNPLIVVMFVVIITQFFKKYKASTAMFIGMVIMPISGLAMAGSQSLESITGTEISILGWFVMHPLTVMMIIGIGIQGLAECFISPRFLEYFALQAPKGEEGVYMGFSHLHSFFSALFGFIMSGFLLDKYCPDPKTLPEGLSEIQIAAYYTDAHIIWYYFVVIAAIAAVALLVFNIVTSRIDKKKILA